MLDCEVGWIQEMFSCDVYNSASQKPGYSNILFHLNSVVVGELS